MTVRDGRLRVLVTRPRTDSDDLVTELRGRGFEVSLEPLLDIRYLEVPAPQLDGVQALIFTSANGVRAFRRRSGEKSMPVFAVGDATARTASDAGFEHVESASGNVESLTSLILGSLDRQAGRLLHVAGSAVAGDLAGELATAGFTVERIVLYEAIAAKSLSTRTIEALRGGEIDLVLLFSPRTAFTFVKLVVESGLSSACRSVSAICLSDAVAAAVDKLDWRRKWTAAEPKLSALLAVLEDARLEEDGTG